MGRQKTGGDQAKAQKAWEQIQKQRALQKQQKVRRVAAIVVAVLVVACLLGVGVWALVGKNSSQSVAGKGLMTSVKLSDSSVKDPDKIQGFVIGPEGAGSFKEGVPNIELYLSYGCPACLNIEHLVGDDLLKMAKNGRANLIVHIVDTHGLPWTFIAGDAVYQVAKGDPEKVLAFHDGLMKFGYELMFKDDKSIQAQGNGTLMANPEQSLAKVKEIAAKTGVKAEVVDSFKARISNAVVSTWAKNWVEVASKQTEQISTPMFAKNGKIISLAQWDSKTPISDFLVK